MGSAGSVTKKGGTDLKHIRTIKKCALKMSSVLIGAGIVLNILPFYTPQEITVNAVIEGEIDTMHNPAGVTIDLFDYSLYYTDADGNLRETESTAASNGTNARPFGTTKYQCAADATSGIICSDSSRSLREPDHIQLTRAAVLPGG